MQPPRVHPWRLMPETVTNVTEHMVLSSAAKLRHWAWHVRQKAGSLVLPPPPATTATGGSPMCALSAPRTDPRQAHRRVRALWPLARWALLYSQSVTFSHPTTANFLRW